MALHPRIITITDRDDLEDVLATMSEFAGRRRGWLNVQPDVAPDAERVHRSGIVQFFRRNSPEAALGTWMPPSAKDTDTTQSLGLQHALGTRISPVLDEWGLPPDPEWRRIQDSPRRGLLLGAPAEAAHDTIIRWLLDVTQRATTVRTTGTWSVSAYEGRPAS